MTEHEDTGYRDALSSLSNVSRLRMVNSITGHTLALGLAEGANGYTFQTSWKDCS
jgi:hypothetical protein